MRATLLKETLKSLFPVRRDDGSIALERDELPRPNTTLADLSALKPAFEAMGNHPLDEAQTTYAGLVRQRYPDLQIRHVHLAGNSSGVADGAAAVLLASP